VLVGYPAELLEGADSDGLDEVSHVPAVGPSGLLAPQAGQPDFLLGDVGDDLEGRSASCPAGLVARAVVVSSGFRSGMFLIVAQRNSTPLLRYVIIAFIT